MLRSHGPTFRRIGPSQPVDEKLPAHYATACCSDRPETLSSKWCNESPLHAWITSITSCPIKSCFDCRPCNNVANRCKEMTNDRLYLFSSEPDSALVCIRCAGPTWLICAIFYHTSYFSIAYMYSQTALGLVVRVWCQDPEERPRAKRILAGSTWLQQFDVPDRRGRWGIVFLRWIKTI